MSYFCKESDISTKPRKHKEERERERERDILGLHKQRENQKREKI